jgi:hypothetical protein
MRIENSLREIRTQFRPVRAATYDGQGAHRVCNRIYLELYIICERVDARAQWLPDLRLHDTPESYASTDSSQLQLHRIETLHGNAISIVCLGVAPLLLEPARKGGRRANRLSENVCSSATLPGRADALYSAQSWRWCSGKSDRLNGTGALLKHASLLSLFPDWSAAGMPGRADSLSEERGGSLLLEERTSLCIWFSCPSLSSSLLVVSVRLWANCLPVRATSRPCSLWPDKGYLARCGNT